MIPLVVAGVIYFLIGLFIARAEAEYLNQKFILSGKKFGGKQVTWSTFFWPTMLVLFTPFIWPTIPLLMIGGAVGAKGNELAVYVGKELVNPRNNIKEI